MPDDLVVLPLAERREDGLLPVDAAWMSHWVAMPAYERGSTEAFQRIVVHFSSQEDVNKFVGLVRDHIDRDVTSRTDTVFFGAREEKIAVSDMMFVSDGQTTPRYPIYVISKGRWKTPLTTEALRGMGVAHRVVVEPSEAEDYARALGRERLLVAPEDFSRRGQGSIPVRNFVWDHAVKSGATKHWILDDNVRGWIRSHRNRRIPVGDGAVFCAVEDFVDRYDNVGLSGFSYTYLAPDRKDSFPPFFLNTRIYSMILIDHRVEHRWRGRYNEDTDLSLRVLKDGWCTVLFNAFTGDKVGTLQMRGGNEQIYAESDKRRVFAESLVEQHPDVAHVVWRYNRWHHEVNYRPFARNKLILREGWQPPADPEYGMRLVKLDRPGRFLRAAPVAPEPVVISVTPRDKSAEPAGARGEVASLIPIEVAPRAEKRKTRPAATTREPSATTLQVVSPPAAAAVFAPRTSRLGQPATGVVPPDPFLAHHAATLAAAGDARLVLDEAAWDRDSREAVGLDCEVFGNFFVACMVRFSDGRRIAFEKSARCELDAEGLRRELERNLLFTFNGLSYDIPICYLALSGASLEQLKAASDRIVRGSLKPWDVGRELGVRTPKLNHVDLMEPNPSVRQSLKMLAGRLHARFLIDLPFDPDAYLSHRQMNVATLYCLNDVDHLRLLREAMAPATELRVALGKEHKTDFRSKSDAQIGEAILLGRVTKTTGKRPQKPKDVGARRFRYQPPSWAEFTTPALREIVARLADEEITTDAGGKVSLPKAVDGAVVRIGAGSYAMGIGGLHSQEEHRAIVADEGHAIEDVDVSSHYPRIILGLGLYPEMLGKTFLEVYRGIFDERNDPARGSKALERVATDPRERQMLRAKSEGLKIVLNGSGFGKSASPYSPLYAPHMFAAITLTGQLSVLLLIEWAEAAGIAVASANTDGVIFHYRRSLRPALDAVLSRWEQATGYELERTPYRALYSSSVNTYVAVKEDGKTKRKGPIADPWGEGTLREMMSKNPQMTVCSEAVVRRLVDGVPPQETIRALTDPRQFLTVVRVASGGTWRGQKLGRAVRYYWSKDGDPIMRADGGGKVSKTDGARPWVELPEQLPSDLDVDRYVREAEKLLVDLGLSSMGV